MSSTLPTRQGAKATGAFYTPKALAELLADWIIRPGSQSLLEPSAGEGALIRAALSRANEISATACFLACDIDEPSVVALRAELDPNHVCVAQDFLDLQAASFPSVDGVLTNPPFTRNHSLPTERRDELRRRFEIQGAAGLWVHFLLHACEFLKPGGRMAAIVPAAALFTRYGRKALERLCSDFASVELRQIIDRPSWVNGAEERGAILLAEGYKVGRCVVPDATQWTSAGLLLPFVHAGNPLWFDEAMRASVPLSSLASVAIGAVTGRNTSFLLSESERVRDEIPLAHVRPIASRSRHIPGLSVSIADLNNLANRGERTWLLSPDSLDRVTALGARRRLAQIPVEARKNTVWLKKRSPWWRVDPGPACDAIFTYMNDEGPRLVLAGPGIICSNTLHRVNFKTADRAEQMSCALSMISTFGQLAAEMSGRQYGGGVLKFELDDLRSLPVLTRGKVLSKDQLDRLNELLIAGDAHIARRQADRLLLPRVFGSRWREAAREMERELFSRRSRRKSSKK